MNAFGVDLHGWPILKTNSVRMVKIMFLARADYVSVDEGSFELEFTFPCYQPTLATPQENRFSYEP